MSLLMFTAVLGVLVWQATLLELTYWIILI